jgi:hypothetical protein
VTGPHDGGTSVDGRGDDPARTVGTWPGTPVEPLEPDPGWQPDPNAGKTWEARFNDIAHRRRPRREDVLPYLLIRAFSPGDRGARPTYPPTACWESPDLLLIDASYAGPFDPTRLVGSPTAGRVYRVFVRVWNLGLLEAPGVHVMGWYVDPGFFSGQSGYKLDFIGGRFVDLTDRTRAGAQALVELDAPWVVPTTLTGHDCLVASATCPTDRGSGSFDANADRHIGQRNLTILTGPQPMEVLLGRLGQQVPTGGAIELMHAGPAVVPLLQAIVGGGLLVDGPNGPERVRPAGPDFGSLRQGVTTSGGQHVLTLIAGQSSTIIARSDVVAQILPPGQPRADPFATPGGVARLLRELDPATAREITTTSKEPVARALPQALAALLGVGELAAGTAAKAFGGPPGCQHLLRFLATDADGRLLGGYSLVLA